jgi:prepilin-type processing-associated H-X9-DG protein
MLRNVDAHTFTLRSARSAGKNNILFAGGSVEEISTVSAEDKTTNG